ncbi:type VI secretion system contractile sheath large subunit [Nostoc sp. 3335mG]|nr:type VI secretion system contractile sheath large subunit [Nostoc sp. 3335mG]
MATNPQIDQVSSEATTAELDDFSALLKQSFKPRSERAETEIESAVGTLVRQALADASVVKDDVLDTIDEMIARLDEKLSLQVNEIIHAPEFQTLEGAWLGLKYLTDKSETDSTLKIKVMNISKKELFQASRTYNDAKWDQSPLFKKIYEAEFGQLGGQPYGALVGDYYFGPGPTDIAVLQFLSRIAAASHAVYFSGADSTLLDMDSWNQLMNPRDLSLVFDRPDYAPWRSLRDSVDSRYLGLCMPRVLARLPYGAKGLPVEGFAFEEETDGHDGKKFTWMNAAYAMAANVNRAFKEYGWTVRIRGMNAGGVVEGLPTHTFATDDGSIDHKCPTEIAISDRREAELSKSGLLPLIHRKNTDVAAFLGGQSVYQPKAFIKPEDTAADNLAARIPYMFAVSRFAHYLKCIVRDWIGDTMEQEQLQRKLQTWIYQYVEGDPANATDRAKAERPLADAKVEVLPDEENPGHYKARFWLRPHYQLEGMDIGMSLVSKIEKASG